jgi:hypothetical protein
MVKVRAQTVTDANNTCSDGHGVAVKMGVVMSIEKGGGCTQMEMYMDIWENRSAT